MYFVFFVFAPTNRKLPNHWIKKASGHFAKTSISSTVEPPKKLKDQPETHGKRSLGATTTSGSMVIEMTPVS